MSSHAWLVGGVAALAGVLAQAPQPKPPPLRPPPPLPPVPGGAVPGPPVPAAPGAQVAPIRSGAAILGRPGIRTLYGDPGGPAPPPSGQGVPAVGPPQPPLTVPLNETVKFAPTMEEGPFQQPTLRGLFRWDLQQPASR